MQFHIKFDNLKITLDKRFSVRDTPGLEVTVDNYEVRGDAEVLMQCVSDLTQQMIKLQNTDEGFDEIFNRMHKTTAEEFAPENQPEMHDEAR
jgi:ribosomal protein L16 Arg81 hydroxylase